MQLGSADDRDLSPDEQSRLRELPPLSIYQLLALVPGALIPWTDLVAALYRTQLEPRLREIAICRQARAARAVYELHQHRLVAQSNGVTDTELDAITREPVVESLDPTVNLVCAAADEIELSATLSDQTLRALVDALGEQQAAELILVLSLYSAVARFTNAARARIETGNPLSGLANPGIE